MLRNGVSGAVVVRGVARLQGGRGYDLSGCGEVEWCNYSESFTPHALLCAARACVLHVAARVATCVASHT